MGLQGREAAKVCDYWLFYIWNPMGLQGCEALAVLANIIARAWTGGACAKCTVI